MRIANQTVNCMDDYLLVGCSNDDYLLVSCSDDDYSLVGCSDEDFFAGRS